MERKQSFVTLAPDQFIGKLTDLSVWNLPLEERAIEALTSSCGKNKVKLTNGLVWDWSRVKLVPGFEERLKMTTANEVCIHTNGRIWINISYTLKIT